MSSPIRYPFSSSTSSITTTRKLVYFLASLYALALFRQLHLSSSSSPSLNVPSADSSDKHDASASSTGSPRTDDLASLWADPEEEGGAGVVVNHGEGSPENAWRAHNALAMRKLLRCLAVQNCDAHQKMVVILGEDDYRKAQLGSPGGEKIFSQSVIRTLGVLGVTYLYANSVDQIATFYNMIPDLIVAVIVRPQEMSEIWGDRDGSLLKTRSNPRGIRIQDCFTQEFFGSKAHSHPTGGGPWVLVPERFQNEGETYLGYSVEAECMAVDVHPTGERPKQAYVFAKHLRYFYEDGYPYSHDIFEKASKELGIEFVGAFDNEDHLDKPTSIPGLRNLGGDGAGGLIPKEQFELELQRSLVVIGIGSPFVSPTPWYSICYGTPFLQPEKWHLDDEGKKVVDWIQHPFVAHIGEPYSYLVNQHDDAHFIAQLQKAIALPHTQHVPEHMTQKAMNERVLEWLRRDWKGELKKRLESDEKLREMFESKSVLL